MDLRHTKSGYYNYLGTLRYKLAEGFWEGEIPTYKQTNWT